MNETIRLAEQHILESLARLKHVDELMERPINRTAPRHWRPTPLPSWQP